MNLEVIYWAHVARRTYDLMYPFGMHGNMIRSTRWEWAYWSQLVDTKVRWENERCSVCGKRLDHIHERVSEKQVIPKVNGKTFRCEDCGSNVFSVRAVYWVKTNA